MALSDEQRRAVEARGRGVLVAAAAGSGKTTVLTERVAGLVLDRDDPVDVDRLLVVTFTEAAAREMRERIGRRLEEALTEPGSDAAHLERQLTLLAKASISTLHAFCLGVVREHFHRLGVDPTLGVMGEHEAMLARGESVERLLADRYASGDGAFRELLAAYGGSRAASVLGRLVLDLHAYAWTLPRPEAWLAERAADFAVAADARVEELPAWPSVLRWVRTSLAEARAALRRADTLAAAPGGPAAHRRAIQADLDAVAAALEVARGAAGFDELAAAVEAIPFGRAAPVKDADPDIKERATKARARAKDRVKAIRERLLGVPAETWLADHRSLAAPMTTLAELVVDFDARYRALKRRRNVLDFSDLERLALAALGEWNDAAGRFEATDVACALRDHYREVLVDEYQDVNELQETLLGLVAAGSPEPGGVSPNRFIVGDVKQSIYGFRHTTPELFVERLTAYARDATAERIVLGRNYRSRACVLDDVNALFRRVMTRELSGLDYDENHELVLGATDYPAEGEAALELHLVPRDRDAPEEGDGGGEDGEGAGADPSAEVIGELDATEREALVVARRIRALVLGDPDTGEEPARVFDRELGALRPARWRDVVILLRTPRGKANVFLDVLAELDIPGHAELGTGWFAATEIETALSLLTVIDNPREDIALAAVLRSPIVGLDVAELARVRLAARGAPFVEAVRAAASGEGGEEIAPELASRLRGFLERLEGWRTAARRGPLSALVWRIYDETRFVDQCAAMPGGPQRRANLLGLHERAREFDHFARQGLVRFLRFIERLREQEGDLGTVPPAGASDDVVRISSIHRSKGLEFPIVVVADLGKAWNEEDLRGDLLFHRRLGFGPKVVDRGRRVKYPSLMHRAVVAERRLDLRAEEMRVLYVAMTRARERLLLVGSARGLDDKLEVWAGDPLDGASVSTAGTMLDWIVPVFGERARRWTAEELAAALASGEGAARATVAVPWADLAALRPAARGGAPPSLPEELARRFAWRYPHREAASRFAKMTVSELKRRFVTGAPDEEAAPVDATRVEERLHAPYAWVPNLPERPAFLERAREGAAAPPPSAAEIGTATHAVMEHLDLGSPLDLVGVTEQLEGLVRSGVLSRAQAEAVDLASVADFFATDLGRRIVAARAWVRRELPFTLGLPAGEVHDGVADLDADDRVVVQGVIDLLVPLEDDAGFLLVDFKTGGARRAGLDERVAAHRGQMALYRRAVEDIFRQPVREGYLCFLDLRESRRVI